MSLSVMAVFWFLDISALTAKSLTIEQVDWTIDFRDGSFGRFVSISVKFVCKYWAMDSPHGKNILKGNCDARALILVIDLLFIVVSIFVLNCVLVIVLSIFIDLIVLLAAVVTAVLF